MPDETHDLSDTLEPIEGGVTATPARSPGRISAHTLEAARAVVRYHANLVNRPSPPDKPEPASGS